MAAASQVFTTPSGLVAIALVVRSRDGPRFVFHYPPRPALESSQRHACFGTELDRGESDEDTADEEESDDSDLEDGGYRHLQQSFEKIDLNGKVNKRKASYAESLEDDEHYDNPDGERVVPWEYMFDFPTKDLESILTPSRAYHKTKFELSLDPLYFVSYPVHIREDGLWKKKRDRRLKIKDGPDPSDVSSTGHGNDAENESKEVNDGRATADTTSDDGEERSGMTMFNVFFVLKPPKAEEDERILEIYEHVIKKLNKAMKHAQAQSDYVWKESRMILNMKEKAREERRPMSWLWTEILLKSTMAKAIRGVYEGVCNNTIANVHLSSKPPLDLSLQIPVPSFLTSLPGSTERAMPGLPLTTANPVIDEEGNEDPTHLSKHFALLLLGDESKIVTEIQTDNTELSDPLVTCIRLCKPTLSFLQVAQINSIDLSSLLVLAQHLIYWRRAIAICPLHARETYIISPNADNHKLPIASVAWKRAFPLAPSLPNFLASLSAAPRPYKTFPPSKDHRATYFDMLAWLVRGGWVTQLRTFAWILVWPEIIYEVEYELKAEALEKAKKAAENKISLTHHEDSADDSSSSSPRSRNSNSDSDTDASQSLTTEQAAEKARLSRLAAKAAVEAAADAAEFAKKPAPVATAHPSVNKAEHLKHISPYIIVDPHRVSHVESLYIAALAKRFTEPKIKECWFRFAKRYFSGKEALEGVALREGMKRKETWGILMQYSEFLLICKHW